MFRDNTDCLIAVLSLIIVGFPDSFFLFFLFLFFLSWIMVERLHQRDKEKWKSIREKNGKIKIKIERDVESRFDDCSFHG